MNPTDVLIPALAAVLQAPPLTVAGVAVPVAEHFATGQAGHYVEIDQPTDTDAGGTATCRRFSVTALLNVVTQFEGVVSSGPVAALVDEIHARLRGQRLPLPAGWTCGPGTVEPATQLKEGDGERAAVRRLLRYRWAVEYSF